MKKLLRSKWIPLSMLLGIFLTVSYPVRHPKKTVHYMAYNKVSQAIWKVIY